MRKILTSIFVCLAIALSTSNAQAQQFDPRLKMMLTMAGYGAVGGALLGTASLAFDSKPRAVAKGASLGLYAGILLGGYILVNYEMKKRGIGIDRDYYPNTSDYYEDNHVHVSEGPEAYNLASIEQKKDPRKDPLFSMNFFSLEF